MIKIELTETEARTVLLSLSFDEANWNGKSKERVHRVIKKLEKSILYPDDDEYDRG